MNARVHKLLHFLLERLKEPSSIRGMVWILTGGLTQLAVDNPISIENAASVGMIIAGVLGVVLPDVKKPAEPKNEHQG